MIVTLRLLSGAGAIALASFLLELTHPGWMTELATDARSLPAIRAYLYEELESGQQLEVQMAALVARADAKQRILKNLIDDELNLVEAACRFRDLDWAVQGGQSEPLRVAWPGRSEMERYGEQIIQAVTWELAEQPCRAAAVKQRLKAELQAAAEAGALDSVE